MSLPRRHSSRTCSQLSYSKPGTPSSVPSTRSTFHAGRASPSGRTAAWKVCSRPSVLTKLPGVSLNGAIGSMTCA